MPAHFRCPTVRPALLLAGALLTPALAAPVAPVTRRCVIANIQCFTLKVGFRSLTPEDRIERLNDRLGYIYGHENLSPKNLYIVRRREYADLYVGHSHLITATPEDVAASNGAHDAVEVAQKWARPLRKALPQAVKNSNWDFPMRQPPLSGDRELVR